MLCDYGCGQEARYQIGKKWCCSDHWTKCPSSRRMIGEISKRSHSDPEYKSRTREKTLEQFSRETEEEKFKRIAKIKESMNTDEFHERVSKIQKDQWSKNEAGRKIISEKMTLRLKDPEFRSYLSRKQTERFKDLEERKKLSRLFKRSIESIAKEIPEFLEVEELRYDPERIEDKIIQAHCKNKDCEFSKEKGGWFTPRNVRLTDRIFVFKKKFGNSFLFCSVKCKIESEVFNRRVDVETLDEFLRYRNRVDIYTLMSVEKYKDEIKNIELRGKKNGYDLDHKYSVYEGFINNVDPKIVGHFKNLEVIPSKDNVKKFKKCSISLEILLNLIKEV